jgi:NAD-dependent dihydropyrimidine dehydrogenase PreA subunit
MREFAMRLFPTLTHFRFVIQLLTFLLSVYGALLVGHYAAEKISTALPALSCAYDGLNGGYCVLVPLQHQMDHRVGAAIVRAQQVTVQVLIPVFFTLSTFLLFFFILGKAFCAWVCPLGTIQEWLYRLGRKLGFANRNVPAASIGKLRPVKWLILIGLVFVLPLLVGLGYAPQTAGNPYCDICPSRIITTLLTGNTEELALKVSDGVSLSLGIIGNILVGFVIAAALAVRQPFCRICPMLAMNAIFRHASLLRLVKVENPKCDKCGICTRACPMDIPEIHHEHGRKAYNEDCTLCGRCAEFCPDDQVIKLKLGPLTLFSSSREYYKKRLKIETPEGEIKPIRIYRKEAVTRGD